MLEKYLRLDIFLFLFRYNNSFVIRYVIIFFDKVYCELDSTPFIYL